MTTTMEGFNSSTDQWVPPSLHREATAYHGHWFHIKFLFLFHLRCAETHPQAMLATEVAEAHKHDDAVCFYRNREGQMVSIFTQLKHRSAETVDRLIDCESLIPKKGGPYDLKKYVESYCYVRDEFKDNYGVKKFIIFTNNSFDMDKLQINGDLPVKFILRPAQENDPLLQDPIGGSNVEDEELSQITSQGKCYQLDVEDTKPLLEEWEKGSKKNSVKISESDVKEFLECSLWFVNQLNEEQLGDLIKYKVCRMICSRDVDMYVNHFLTSIFYWMSKKQHRYISSSEFKSQLERAYIERPDYVTVFTLMEKYFYEIKRLKVSFDIPETLRFFIQGVSVTCRIMKMISHLKFGAKKVCQVLTNEKYFLFLELSVVKICAEKVLKAFNTEWVNFLAITVDSESLEQDDIKEFFNRIFHIVHSKATKRILFVCREHNSAFDSLIRDNTDMDVVSMDDVITFKSLNRQSRNEFLDTKIVLQGKETNVKRLLRIENLEQEAFATLDIIVREDTLMEFALGNPIFIGEEIQQLGEEESQSYVERSFNSRIVLKETLVSLSEPLLVFSGSYNLIRDIIPNVVTYEMYEKQIEKVQQYRDNKTFDSRIFVIDNESKISRIFMSADYSESERIFSKLIENYPDKTLHWLRVEETNTMELTWHKSHRGQFPSEHTLPCLQDQLLQRVSEGRPLLVTGAPGMGKSTTLTNICLSFKNLHPDYWLIRVNINDHSSVLRHYKSEFNPDSLKDFFINCVLTSNATSQLEKILLRIFLFNESNVILIVDGFDEISPTYKDLVLNFLKVVKTKMVVSTRPHMQEELRKELGVRDVDVVTLTPFTPEKQQIFMINTIRYLWTKNLVAADTIDQEELKKLSSYLIHTVTNMIKDQKKEFTNAPLHIKMITEIFEDGNVLREMKIHKLFEKFIQKKFQIYDDDKLRTETAGSVASCIDVKKYSQGLYEKLALYAMLAEEDFYLLVPTCDDLEEALRRIEMGEENKGIISGLSNNIPIFIHQTFTEYFAASYVKKIFLRGHPDKSVRSLLLNSLLVQKYFQIFRVFLNSMLSENVDINTLKRKKWLLKPSVEDGSMYVAAVEGLFYIFKMLMDNSGELVFRDLIKYVINQNKDCIETVIEKGHLNILQLIHNKCFVKDELYDEEQAARWAVKYDQLSSLQWMLKPRLHGGREINVHCEDWRGNTLVFWSVEMGKIDILKWLLKPTNEGGGGGDTNRRNRFGLLPSHYAARLGFIEIVKFLKDKNEDGICSCAKDKNGLSVMHEAAFGGSIEVFNFLVSPKEEGGCGFDPNDRTDDGRLPLHLATNGGHIKMLKWFVSPRDKGGCGFDIKDKTLNGRSVLHFAANGGKIEILRWLITPIEQGGCGFDPKYKSKINGRSLLHSAAYGGRLEVMQWLAAPKEKGGFDLDMRDRTQHGTSVLHYAAYGGNLELLQWLVAPKEQEGCGLDINERDNIGRTVLHWALYEGHLELVKWLVLSKELNGCGMDLNDKMMDDDSSLHCAAYGGHLKLVQWLISPRAEGGGGVDLRIKGDNGKTAVHCAAEMDQLELLKWLVSTCRLDINDKTVDGKSVLQIAKEKNAQCVMEWLTSPLGNKFQ